ncbi:glycoside hydrolase family 15 protein, partial [Nonomuraea sp. NPDC003201]
PDAGIWELDDRAWTHSRLNCAAGLRAVGENAPADTIVADTAAHATHPSGRWQRAPDDPRIDGALLLPAIRGAAHQQGDVPTALRWFERNRAACGPAGLLSEEYDVTQRQMRGNLPQAFVHALLLECAARLNQ